MSRSTYTWRSGASQSSKKSGVCGRSPSAARSHNLLKSCTKTLRSPSRSPAIKSEKRISQPRAFGGSSTCKDLHSNQENLFSRMKKVKAKKTIRKTAFNRRPPKKTVTSLSLTKQRLDEPKVYRETVVHESGVEKGEFRNIPKILVTLVESESWQSSSGTTQREVFFSQSGDSAETHAEAGGIDETIVSSQMSDTLDSEECITDSLKDSKLRGRSGQLDCLRQAVQECKVGVDLWDGNETRKDHQFSGQNNTKYLNPLYQSAKRSLPTPLDEVTTLITSDDNISLLPANTGGETSRSGQPQITQPSTSWRVGEEKMTISIKGSTCPKYTRKLGSKPLPNLLPSRVCKKYVKDKHTFISGEKQPHLIVDASSDNEVTKVTYACQSHQSENEDDKETKEREARESSGSVNRVVISKATRTQTTLTVKREVEVDVNIEYHRVDHEPSTVGSLSTLPPFTLPEHCTYLDGLIRDDSPNIVCSTTQKAAIAGVSTMKKGRDKLTPPNNMALMQGKEILKPEIGENTCGEERRKLVNDPVSILIPTKGTNEMTTGRAHRELSESARTLQKVSHGQNMNWGKAGDLMETQGQKILKTHDWNCTILSESSDIACYTACLARKKYLSSVAAPTLSPSGEIIFFNTTNFNQWSQSDESIHTAMDKRPVHQKVKATQQSSREAVLVYLKKAVAMGNVEMSMPRNTRVSGDIKTRKWAETPNSGAAVNPISSNNSLRTDLETTLSSGQNALFPINVANASGSLNSLPTEPTLPMVPKPVSLTSISSFETEECISNRRENTIDLVKEAAKAVGEKMLGNTHSSSPRSLVVEAVNSRDVDLLNQSSVEVYYDISPCMDPSRLKNERGVSAEIQVSLGEETDLRRATEVETLVENSLMGTASLGRDVQIIRTQRPDLEKREKERRKMVHSPQGDQQKPMAIRSPATKRKNTRKIPVMRLPVLSLSGISPERVPHIIGEYSNSSTDSINCARGMKKEVTSFIDRSPVAFNFISTPKTQHQMFEKHLKQIQRPPTWNHTVFTAPKHVLLDYRRIHRRQAVAYGKKVHQLSATRLLNGNNSASVETSCRKAPRRCFRYILPEADGACHKYWQPLEKVDEVKFPNHASHLSYTSDLYLFTNVRRCERESAYRKQVTELSCTLLEVELRGSPRVEAVSPIAGVRCCNPICECADQMPGSNIRSTVRDVWAVAPQQTEEVNDDTTYWPDLLKIGELSSILDDWESATGEILPPRLLSNTIHLRRRCQDGVMSGQRAWAFTISFDFAVISEKKGHLKGVE